ncbi:uncharacterized protein LOC117582120 [Drosophila guanche]|uniref:uncharacterized protein LOC117582120 n=1 Tax=Drosophila guanche TaxID=7266 RepID=UPI00147199F6|nr:uncharacterized protein LOC117582120 [Drosophila guanche]
MNSQNEENLFASNQQGDNRNTQEVAGGEVASDGTQPAEAEPGPQIAAEATAAGAINNTVPCVQQRRTRTQQQTFRYTENELRQIRQQLFRPVQEAYLTVRFWY